MLDKNKFNLIICLALLMFVGVNNIAVAEEPKTYGFEQVLLMMLERHPALSGKRAEVQAKKFYGDSARAARYPSITGQAGYQRNNIQGSSVPTQNTKSVTLRARQALWAFGRIDADIDYADANVLADKADLLRVKRDLLEKTAIAYGQVLSVYNRQKVIEDNISSHKDLYQQIKRRELGGLASKADSQLALLRLIQARGQRNRIEGDLLLGLNELQSLIQAPIQKLLPISEHLFDFPEPMSDVESQAVQHSAELQYKQRLLDLADRNEEKEETADMPIIYLQAERQFNQLGLTDGTSYSVTIEGALNGMGLSNAGRANAAGSQRDAASESLKVSHNDIVRKVRSLLKNRDLQSELIGIYEHSVNETQSILKSYIRQYEAGNKSWLEVLNMQREKADQQLQLAQAKSDWLSYTLQLANLVGELDTLAGQE